MSISAEVLEIAHRIAEREQEYFAMAYDRRKRDAHCDRATTLEQIMTSTTTPQRPATVVSPIPSTPSREALVAEFNRDAKLQHEFLSVDAYVAFREAEARGRFKLLRRV